ncbi:MAG: hypothetical protein CME55_01445, partial [Halieaceae bacterium]|nr:hypothetical protein [Halieaceae bacterium]
DQFLFAQDYGVECDATESFFPRVSGLGAVGKVAVTSNNDLKCCAHAALYFVLVLMLSQCA